MDYYGRQLAAHKAVLHMHSKNSDGSFTPQEMIDFYSEKGYEIYAFTDHHKANPISTYDSKGMTLISGMEIHPMGPRGIVWHFVGLGVPEDFTEPKGEWQEVVNAVIKIGGIMICAHPYWCGFTSDEVKQVQGILGIEVYNSACKYIGRAYNMQLWDELNDAGRLLPAVAVDDAHSKSDFFMGWTNILTNEPLSQKVVLDALKAGDFYASQGPEFKKLSYLDGVFEAEFTPCVEVIGLSNLSSGYCAACERATSETIGEITCCKFTLKKRPNGWFRLQIKDKNGKYAWSNPIRVED